jgi:hypothetical protein
MFATLNKMGKRKKILRQPIIMGVIFQRISKKYLKTCFPAFSAKKLNAELRRQAKSTESWGGGLINCLYCRGLAVGSDSCGSFMNQMKREIVLPAGVRLCVAALP